MSDLSSAIIMTLGFVIKEEKILLGLKKRGFGEGFWNGFGGKLLKNESLEEGMKRELQEECSLIAHSMTKVAFLKFNFNDGKVIHGHVFMIKDFSGSPIPSEEMEPKWYSIENIPYDKMWEDDRYWLPHILNGKKIEAYFTFSSSNIMLSHDVRITEQLPDYTLQDKTSM